MKQHNTEELWDRISGKSFTDRAQIIYNWTVTQYISKRVMFELVAKHFEKA